MTATSLKTLVACALLYASTCWGESIPVYLDTSTSEATHPGGFIQGGTRAI